MKRKRRVALTVRKDAGGLQRDGRQRTDMIQHSAPEPSPQRVVDERLDVDRVTRVADARAYRDRQVLCRKGKKKKSRQSIIDCRPRSLEQA